MTIFLSYSYRDERVATQIANRLLSSGYEIWTFEYAELTEGPHDFLKECQACAVIFSGNSVVTDAVRLSNRLGGYKLLSRVFCDDGWEPDNQARIVFERFQVERIVFDNDTLFRRMIRLFSEAISAGFSLGDSTGPAAGEENPFLARSRRVTDAARHFGLLKCSLPLGLDWDMAKPPKKPGKSRKAKPLRKVLSAFPDSQLMKTGKRRVRSSLRKAAKPLE